MDSSTGRENGRTISDVGEWLVHRDEGGDHPRVETVRIPQTWFDQGAEVTLQAREPREPRVSGNHPHGPSRIL